MATRFEVVLADDGSYLFQLRDAAGELLLKGLGTQSKIMTQNELLHLRGSLRDPSRLVPHTNDDGTCFVVIKDKDGSVLARSRRAPTPSALQVIVDEIVAAGAAPMIDLSKHRSAV